MVKQQLLIYTFTHKTALLTEIVTVSHFLVRNNLGVVILRRFSRKSIQIIHARGKLV